MSNIDWDFVSQLERSIMAKPKERIKVVSCSGIVDPDLPALPKCPFFNPRFDECSLDDDIYDNPVQIPITVIPANCKLRFFDIEVYTEELNQTEIKI